MSNLAQIKLLFLRTEGSLENTTILLAQLKSEIEAYEAGKGKLLSEADKLT